MTSIGAAAVGATLSEYLAVISRESTSAEAHRSVMAFLQRVIGAAKSG
ncbi:MULTISPECIES: hypothetical protein [Pseudofrankia]|nr:MULTISPECIES: hypothetical protein [Pseudofrankia]